MPEDNDDIMELMRAENERLMDVLVPLSWCSSSQDLYVYWDKEKKKDVLKGKDKYKRFLKSLGLTGTKRPSENMSEVEAYLAKIDANRGVDYIGEIDCLAHGFGEIGKQRFYNTLEEQRHPPDPSSIKVIDEDLAAFLGGKEHPQFSLMRRVFKRHIVCKVLGRFQIPPMIVFAGDSFAESQIFSSLFTLVLGGKVIDPTPYLEGRMTKGTSAALAGAIHWSVTSLAKNSGSLLHRMLIIKELPYGIDNEVKLPFISQRTVFVHNKAKDLMELPHHLLDLANVIYLHPLKGYRCRFENADFVGYRDNLFDPGAEEVRGGYVAPEVAQTLFGATLAGEAYQVLALNMSGENVSLDEQAILTRIENSSRHFQNRMNREKSTPRAILEAIAGRYPDQICRVSETHWKFNFPQTTQDHEQPSSLQHE